MCLCVFLCVCVWNFEPALPLPISCETALALERQALKCLRFARTWLYFEQNNPFCPYFSNERPFLSIFLTKLSVFKCTKLPVFVHIFVQMHKITRFDRFFCSDDPNYPFCSIFGYSKAFLCKRCK